MLGLELENTTNGEAYDNEAYNNSGGMAVFLLGNLTKKSAAGNLVHDNQIHDNNGKNFGDPKTVVSGVPTGTGLIVVGSSGTEIRNNTIQNNESAGVLVVSYTLMTVLIQGATAASPAPSAAAPGSGTARTTTARAPRTRSTTWCRSASSTSPRPRRRCARPSSIRRDRRPSRTARDRTMPPVGHDMIHAEGVALLKAWIDAMPPQTCQ